MNGCPSPEEWRSLLDRQVADADEQRIAEHIEICPHCSEQWDAISRGFETNAVDGDAADVPVPPFLKRFQGQLPDELLSTELEDKDRHALIEFPGPPTLIGKLGQLEHFHIRREVGRGATGVVYHAWDENLDRDVAIKVLKPELLSIELVRTRFEREARTVSRVSHEHIIKVHEIRSVPAFPPYLVMDYVAGESVAHLIERNKSLRPREAARLVQQVAEGLAAAHSADLVHRDIKPSNVLLKADPANPDQLGSPIITDFGLARTTAMHDRGPRGRLTLSGESIGTPEYMSPEQIARPESIDGRSDLFSLGVVLYELLTGRPPFQAASVQDTLRVIRFDEPPAPRRLDARIPRDLETICLRCLEKDPRRRFTTAQTLADELNRFLTGVPILSRPVGTIERVWRWSRRKPALAGLSGLAVLGLAVGIAAFVSFTLFKTRISKQDEINEAIKALDRGLNLCRNGDASQGMLWLSRSLERAPADAVSLQRLIRGNLAGWYPHLSPLKAICEQQYRVLAVAFSPDGRTFLTGNADGAAQLWDTATGLPIGKPFPHPMQVLAVAFQPPKGEVIATGCLDANVRLWKTNSGELVCPPRPHQRPVHAVSFSPNGETVISGSMDGTVKLWDAASGEEKGELGHPGEYVLSLALSSDGETIATGTQTPFGKTGLVRFWNVATKKPSRKPIKYEGPVWALAWSPDDQSIVTGSLIEALHWEIAGPDERPIGEPLRHGAEVRSVAFSADGGTILTGSNDKTARLWDAVSGRPQGAPLHHEREVRSVAFNLDNTLILTGSEDNSARLWQATSMKRLGYHFPGTGAVAAVAFSPDGKVAVTGARDNKARLWDVTRGMPLEGSRPYLEHDGEVLAVAVSPDGKKVLTGSADKTAMLWNAQTGLPLLATPLRHGDKVSCVAFSPDGMKIVTGSDDNKARIWDASSGAPGPVLSHAKPVVTAMFSSQSTMVLTGSFDGTAKLSKADNGELVASFLGHDDSVLAAAISPDDKTILTGSLDGTARFWDAVTGKPRGEPLHHHGRVNAVAFRADGKIAATGSEDTTARLWNVADGTPRGEPMQHRKAVLSVNFGPLESELLLTGSNDNTAQLWDITATKPFGPPFQHAGIVWNAVFCPDEKTVLTATEGGAWRWKLPPPLKGSPQGIVLWTQVLTGAYLDDVRVTHLMNAREWQQRRQRLDELGGPPSSVIP